MRTPKPLIAPLLSLMLLGGCYLSHGRDTRDAGAPPGLRDSGLRDAGSPGRDAGPPDAGPPDAGAEDAGPPRALRWIELGPDAEHPPARLNHLAVYDRDLDRVIVFGCFDPYGEVGGCCLTPYIHHFDVWGLDMRTQTWTRLAELPENLLATHPMEVAHDRANDRLVFIAQTDFDGGPSRVFALELGSWSLTRLPSGPWPARSGPLRSAFDPAANELVVHDAVFEDTTGGTWALDLGTDTWSTVETEDAPEVRFHTPLSSAGAGTFYMYGGFAHAGDGVGELWRLDRRRGRWTPVVLDAEQVGRWSHRAIYEPVRGRLVVFGGSRGVVGRGTLLIDPRSGATEEAELEPAPGFRRDFTMVLDSRRRRAIVFGGALESTRAYGDSWALELP